MKTIKISVDDDGKIIKGIIWDRSDDGESDIVIAVANDTMYIIEGFFEEENYVLNGGIVTDADDIAAVVNEAIVSNEYEQLNKLMSSYLNTEWEDKPGDEIISMLVSEGHTTLSEYFPIPSELVDNFHGFISSTLKAYERSWDRIIESFANRFEPNYFCNLFDWLLSKVTLNTLLVPYLNNVRKE